MASVVKGMDKAMESMNLEKVRKMFYPCIIGYVTNSYPIKQISLVMDKFESQFTDLDVQTSYMEDTMGATTAITTTDCRGEQH
jgi:charged multivesicular body protein 1